MARRDRSSDGGDAEIELIQVDDVVIAAATPTPTPRGWRRVMTGNRALWMTAAVALVALVGGLVLGRFVISPFDAAAGEGAPEPGLVTVPVEYGTLSNTITMRGDVGYVDATDVSISAASFDGPAVITGEPPEVGSELDVASVALVVTGRPVIVLPGELPAYRALSYGATGPDVLQLKQALVAAGIDVGDVSKDVYDSATARAVGELYTRAGYSAPQLAEGLDEAVRAAEDGVRSARDTLSSAESGLRAASSGPTSVEVQQANNRIASLERQIAAATAEEFRDELAIADLKDELAIARLERKALDAARDTSMEKESVASARDQLSAANDALEAARQEALPALPASEVLYLEGLPRRVDEVNVSRGDVLEGVAMRVSGASLQMAGSLAAADADLLSDGDDAVFELPSGEEHHAVIASITENKDGERYTVELTPDELTVEQVEELQGSNVRVQIPIGATDGEVLSVPYAALTAGPGGESRVEVVVGDPRDGVNAETRLVTVTTGLAADGYVEVTPTEEELSEGDRVVVGS